jgi:tripartite ATP-independent transporter DctM subunit
METGLLALVILAAMVLLLCLGIPIAFTLCGLATFGILYKLGPKGLLLLFNSAYGQSTNFLLIAVPLFIFMANQLKFTGIGEELYAMIYRWLGRLPGGLAIGTVVICAVFAAMAGISSVATVSMGLIALPSMMSRGYNRSLAIGCISAGGALGILIPPSIIMVIYGAIAEVSIGKLFIGGILPGIVLTLIYVVYIFVMALIKPDLAPPIEETYSWREKFSSIKGVFLPILLIILVLGVIYTGICTPTEASAVGAFGAILCALFYKKLTWANLKEALFHTMRLNAMVFWLIIGAMSFTHFAAYAEIQTLVQNSILALPVSPWTIMIAMQFIFFILGMFLDPAGIIMLTIPIFVPVVKALGFDTLWFGILFVVNMEMAYITPPFGFNLFIMRAIVPPGVTMTDIYRSIVPFVLLQAICLALIMVFPELATWLPGLMMTR